MHMLLCLGYLPYTGKERGVSDMENLISFIVAVAAGVVCHYIIKWLDGGK